ncbi:MAG: ATP-binding protein, partial [Verrucomicrobiota bacterium]
VITRVTDILRMIRIHQSLEEVTQSILQTACELTGSAHGSFLRVVPNTQTLVIEATVGPAWNAELRRRKYRVGEGITGFVAENGEPYICKDTACDPLYLSLFPYVKSEMAVPVIVDDAVWGVINLDGLQTCEYGDAHVEKVCLFAELIASAIEFRLKADRERELKNNLVQSEKLSSVGRLLAGIAHEVNNPLAAILSGSHVLGERLGDPELIEIAQMIEKQAERAGSLVQQVLRFSRKGDPSKFKPVDLLTVLRDTIDIVSPQLRLKQASLEVSIEISDHHHARIDPIEIQQVLVNLITNAQHAVEAKGDKGRIIVSVESDDANLFLAVQDNGIGMNAETRKNLFQPFFTTKRKGLGTGLGLSIAEEIVLRHDGELMCTTTEGIGSRFQLKLPFVSVESETPELTPILSPDIPSSREELRILVVDDEAPIRWMLKAILERITHPSRIVLAESGETALREIQNQSFDFIVSDMHMPGLGGADLRDQILAQEPGLMTSFIFITGDLTNPRLSHLREHPGVDVLGKPFAPKKLIQLLQSEDPIDQRVCTVPQVESEIALRH